MAEEVKYQPSKITPLSPEARAAIPEFSETPETVRVLAEEYFKQKTGLNLNTAGQVVASPLFKQWQNTTGYSMKNDSVEEQQKAAQHFATDFATEFYNMKVNEALVSKGLAKSDSNDNALSSVVRGARATGGFLLSTAFKSFTGVFGMFKELFCSTLGAIGSALTADNADKACAAAGKYIDERNKKKKEKAKEAKDKAKAKAETDKEKAEAKKEAAKEKADADKREVEIYTSREAAKNEQLAKIFEQSMAKALSGHKAEIDALKEALASEKEKTLKLEEEKATKLKKPDVK